MFVVILLIVRLPSLAMALLPPCKHGEDPIRHSRLNGLHFLQDLVSAKFHGLARTAPGSPTVSVEKKQNLQ
jgi:hypothetical protein